MKPVSASEFAATDGLADWRYMLWRIVATFKAPSFAAAATLVADIATESDKADHHPDMNLRYPGVVTITLTTHAANGLTNRDLALASTISRLAADAECVADPFAASVLEVALDALDIDAVRPFWRAVLGYRDDQDGNLVDPNGVGPPMWFQQMDVARVQRNRIHFDVSVPHDVAVERVAAALAAGGILVSDDRASAFWVLSDVEGNEACVCTWQDRD